jgi:peroxiredoxin
MEAYRDQYATLFNGGKHVVVIGISVDADTTLASWARELGTPILFASDPTQSVSTPYGAAIPGRSANARHLYVIGPDGRIAHKMVPFRELVADSYTELGQAVQRTLAHSNGNDQK